MAVTHASGGRSTCPALEREMDSSSEAGATPRVRKALRREEQGKAAKARHVENWGTEWWRRRIHELEGISLPRPSTGQEQLEQGWI